MKRIKPLIWSVNRVKKEESMIPKYEEIMLPFLGYLSDGNEHSLSEIHDALAK